jgi:hypothetical protein
MKGVMNTTIKKRRTIKKNAAKTQDLTWKTHSNTEGEKLRASASKYFTIWGAFTNAGGYLII